MKDQGIPNSLIDELRRINHNLFGPTSLPERLADIEEECEELLGHFDEANLKEEIGDLFCSVLMIIRERKLDPIALIEDNIRKIKAREESGHYRATGEQWHEDSL